MCIKKGFVACLMILCFSSTFTPLLAADQGKDGQNVEDETFDRSLKGQLPLSPAQIEEFKQRMQDTKRTLHKRTPPNMVNRSRRLSFETGQKSPVVRIAPGYVTTISFFDSTGEPWPITSVAVGNPNYYNIERPENQANIITIAALEKYVDSNLAITFKSQNMPTTIQLKSVSGEDEGERETDSLVVFRADQRGPNAQRPSIGPKPETAIDSALMRFIDNVPPEKARRISLSSGKDSGADQEGTWDEPEGIIMWEYRGTLYLRTRHNLVWPAWNAVAKGPGNVRVYELSRVPSVMVSQNGVSAVYDVGGSFYDRE